MRRAPRKGNEMQVDWRPIGTLPKQDVNDTVLVYAPTLGVFHAHASSDGKFSDPVYDEWFYDGATHWAPLPEPPKCE